MKAIIDTDRKEIVLIGSATIDEINTFIKERSLEGYSISGTDTSTHWYRGWQDHIEPSNPMAPPYKITCTGDRLVKPDPATSHIYQDFGDEAIKFGYQFINPNKYDAPLGVDPKSSRKIIGMREDDSRRIEPMIADDIQ